MSHRLEVCRAWAAVKTLYLFLALFLAVPAQAGNDARKDGGGGSGGADAAMFDFCRSGNKGIGFDATTNTYAAVCGNYAWSGDTGGVDAAGVWSANTALCSGGCAQYVTCTDDGRGVPDGGSVQDVEACRESGQRVKVNAMHDIVLAMDAVRPGAGCKVFLPELRPGQGSYHIGGCGETLAGVDIRCPTLRPPHDINPIRTVNLRPGRELCLEGRDYDGPNDPRETLQGVTQSGVMMEGVYLLQDMGTTTGTAIVANNDLDRNGDTNAQLAQLGVLAVGTGSDLGSVCSTVSGSDPRCDARDASVIARGDINANIFGRSFNIDVADSDNTNGRLCIDDGLVESATGTCRGDRRVQCTSDAVCTAFTPDLGPCETIQEALQFEMRNRDREQIIASIEFEPACPDDQTLDCLNSGSTYARPDPENVAGACDGGNGFYLGFAPAAAPDLDTASQAGWPLPIPQYLTARQGIGTITFVRVSDIDFSGAPAFQGGSIRQLTFYGRQANDSNKDTLSTGLADVTSGAATLVADQDTPFTGWTVNAFAGMSVILRPSAQTVEQGCVANCREARAILSNTNSTLTVFSNWVTAPAENDPFRISSMSCPYVTSANSLATACDVSVGIRGRSSVQAKARDFSVWEGHLYDTGPGDVAPIFEDFIWGLAKGFATADTGPLRMYRGLFTNMAIRTQGLINIGFGGYGAIEDSIFRDINQGASAIITTDDTRGNIIRNNRFIQTFSPSAAIWVQRGGEILIEGNEFIGHRGSPPILLSSQASTANTPLRDVFILRNVFRGLFNLPFGVTAFDYGYAAIVVAGFNGGSFNGTWGKVTIQDNYGTFFESTGNQPCLIWLDRAIGENLATSYGGFRVVNNSIINVSAGTVPRAVCISDYAANANLKFVADDVGPKVLDPPPVLLQNSSQGVQQPDQPYSYTTAALVNAGGACAAARQGDVVAILDDTVAVGTCTDAAGVLTGGSTFNSVCKCDGAAWVPL